MEQQELLRQFGMVRTAAGTSIYPNHAGAESLGDILREAREQLVQARALVAKLRSDSPPLN